MLAGAASYFQPLPQCGQRRHPIAVPYQTLGQERQTIRQKDRASEPSPVRDALANAGGRFVDRTLSEESHTAQYSWFEYQREPLLRSQHLSGAD
jgi:hypothetical protein